MSAGNQNPFHLRNSTAFRTATSGPPQQAPFGQPTSAWPVHTYIHHIVGPDTAGTQPLALAQQMFSWPLPLAPACTVVHHIFDQTAAASSTNGGPFENCSGTFNQPSTSSAPAFANSAFGLATSAPSMMGGLYWSNTGQPWGSNSTTFGQPYMYTAPAFGERSTGPFGAPFGTSSAPSTSGGLFGNCSMTVDQPSVFGAPAFGFGEPRSTLVFRAIDQQRAVGRNPFGTPSTSPNQPWPQPGFPMPTTHIACPACGAFVGTTVKYKPSFWIDSMTTNGVLSMVHVSHQCITCMKEYEDKSLEELRLEDYAAGRKVGSKMAVGVFGTARQQASSVLSPFAATHRPSLLFGAAENRTPVGTSTDMPGTFPSGASNATSTNFGHCQQKKIQVQTSKTSNPGVLFGSSAPAASVSGAPITTSSDDSMASAASIFGNPVTTSPCGSMTTNPAGIFGTPVRTSSYGFMDTSPVAASVSGTPEKTTFCTSVAAVPAVGFGPAFGAPVVASSHHCRAACSSVGFGPAFGTPVMASSHNGRAASSAVGFGPAFCTLVTTGLSRPTTTSTVAASVLDKPVMTSSCSSSTSSGRVFGALVTTSLFGPTTTSSVAASVPGTSTNTSSCSPITASPVSSSIFGTPVTTSSCSSTTGSVVATVFGAPVTSSYSSTTASSVAARIFGTSVTTPSYSPIETSPVVADTVTGPRVTTSSCGPMTTNAVEADNIDAYVATSSYCPMATSSGGGLPTDTALSGTPMTAPTCSSTTESTGLCASSCVEYKTAPFCFQSWRRALGTIDNGSGDGALGAKPEPTGAAPERPSSSNASSPGTVCAICLGPLQDGCSTDTCSHTFCYTCLVEWAKVRVECPVCKERFKVIIQTDGPQV